MNNRNDDFLARCYRTYLKGQKQEKTKATFLKWLFKLYIAYSICADVLVLIGIVYLILNL